jgi:hypothetical protein
VVEASTVAAVEASTVAVVEAFAVAVVEAFAAAVAEAFAAATVAAASAEAMAATAAAMVAGATDVATVVDSGSALVSGRGLIGAGHIMAITVGMDILTTPTMGTPRAILTVRTNVTPTVMAPMPILPILREVDPGRRAIPYGAAPRRRTATPSRMASGITSANNLPRPRGPLHRERNQIPT